MRSQSTIANSKKEPRIPLIKFKGKRVKHPTISNHNENSISTNVQHEAVKEKNVASKISQAVGVNFWEVKGGAWHGRPIILEDEMEAIQSGFYLKK